MSLFHLGTAASVELFHSANVRLPSSIAHTAKMATCRPERDNGLTGE